MPRWNQSSKIIGAIVVAILSVQVLSVPPEMLCLSTYLMGVPMDGAGHVFLSYVHEDSDEVDAIEQLLTAAGVSVWRDKNDLWPGEEWKLRIKEAISHNALVMVACFSSASVTRERTHMNEELLLAVDELRLRPPNKPWLIPVRLDECHLPRYELGGGRDLDSLQRIDLFGSNREQAMARFVSSIVRMLPVAEQNPLEPTGQQDDRSNVQTLKRLIRQPNADIEFEDRIVGIGDELHSKLVDAETFPTTDASISTQNEVVREVVHRIQQYLALEHDFCQALVVLGTWGRDEHRASTTRSMARVAAATTSGSGLSALVNLRRFVTFPPMYCGSMAAIARGNFGMLKAIALDPQVRHGDGSLPLVAHSNVWWPFDNDELGAQAFAFSVDGTELTDELLTGLSNGRQGKRFTPVSDALHAVLRPAMRDLIPDNLEYTELFDRTEVLLGLFTMDLRLSRGGGPPYIPPPSLGSFSWRNRHSMEGFELLVQRECEQAGESWGPLQAGLFGGSAERAQAAFAAFADEASRARNRYF